MAVRDAALRPLLRREARPVARLVGRRAAPRLRPARVSARRAERPLCARGDARGGAREEGAQPQPGQARQRAARRADRGPAGPLATRRRVRAVRRPQDAPPPQRAGGGGGARDEGEARRSPALAVTAFFLSSTSVFCYRSTSSRARCGSPSRSSPRRGGCRAPTTRGGSCSTGRVKAAASSPFLGARPSSTTSSRGTRPGAILRTASTSARCLRAPSGLATRRRCAQRCCRLALRQTGRAAGSAASSSRECGCARPAGLASTARTTGWEGRG
mmetsp:Transcript_26862/g.78245  ORF Transcript_26862/g.78245 Transcript_26862/m.78245 type:complete len:272 (+) Transcript_26862:580-1395(+)